MHASDWMVAERSAAEELIRLEKQ
jgi:hypothetical protein